MKKKALPIVTYWETGNHPDLAKVNAWSDCPHCGREHCHVIDRRRSPIEVGCEQRPSKRYFVQTQNYGN